MRSWFDSRIIGKTLERVKARGPSTTEATLLEYLHAAWLRSNIDPGFDVSVFDGFEDILPAILSKPIEIPITARALKVQDGGSTLIGKSSIKNHAHNKIFVSNYQEAARWYRQDLSAIPDKIKHRALNGISKSACDLGEFVDRHKDVIDHEESSLGDNPIILGDEMLLSGIVRDIYNASERKLVITKKLKENCFHFESGQRLPGRQRNKEEARFWGYVIDDAHSGNFGSSGFDLPISSTSGGL